MDALEVDRMCEAAGLLDWDRVQRHKNGKSYWRWYVADDGRSAEADTLEEAIQVLKAKPKKKSLTGANDWKAGWPDDMSSDDVADQLG